jgi:hypothetical protein
MNIIFGNHVEKVQDRFTVLELDSFDIGNTGTVVTAWCVLDQIPLTEMSLVEPLIKVHQDLMIQYQAQNWNFCKDALKQLYSRWNGEVDSFYSDLESRVNHYIENPPGLDWTGRLVKKSSESAQD